MDTVCAAADTGKGETAAYTGIFLLLLYIAALRGPRTKCGAASQKIVPQRRKSRRDAENRTSDPLRWKSSPLRWKSSGAGVVNFCAATTPPMEKLTPPMEKLRAADKIYEKLSLPP